MRRLEFLAPRAIECLTACCRPAVVRRTRSWVTYVVTIGALLMVLSNPMFGSVAILLQQACISPFLLALVLIPALQWLRAWRFSVLLTADQRSPSWAMLTLTTQLSFLNLALPFKAGDISFPLLAKRALGVPVPHAAGTMLWCRLVDLCVVGGLLLLYGGLAWPPVLASGYRQVVLGAALTCLLAPIALAPIVITLIDHLRSQPALRWLREGLADSTQMLQGAGGRMFCVAMTMVIWLTHGWICYLAALAVAPNLSFVAAALAAAASNLAFALPVTGVAGLGPPQAAWSTVLQLLGAGWEVATATALMAYGCLTLGSFLTATSMGLWCQSARNRDPAVECAPEAHSTAGSFFHADPQLRSVKPEFLKRLIPFGPVLPRYVVTRGAGRGRRKKRTVLGWRR
jgi:hypothetical protein